MSEQETQPKGPKSFEDCHVCEHQPQHVQFMAMPQLGDGPAEEALFHRYVCTHCNEGTHRHDSKAYAGLNWNGQQLRAVRKLTKSYTPNLTVKVPADVARRLAGRSLDSTEEKS